MKLFSKFFINSNSTLLLKPDELHKVASIAVPTLITSISHGKTQAGIMALAGIGDLFLPKQNGLNQHYLLRSLIYNDLIYNPWIAKIEDFLPNSKFPIKIASYAFSAATAYYSEDFLDYSVRLGDSMKSFTMTNMFFDRKETLSLKTAEKIYQDFLVSPQKGIHSLQSNFLDLLENKFITNFAFVFISNFISRKVDRIFRENIGEYMYGSITSLFLAKNKDDIGQWKKIIPKLARLTGLLTFFEIYKKLEYFLYTYLQQDLDSCFQNSQNYLLLKDDNIEKVLGKNKIEGEILLRNFGDDMIRLKHSSQNLNYFLTEQFALINVIKDLKAKSPDILLPYMISTTIKQKNTNYFTKKKAPLLLSHAELGSNYNSLKNGIIENFRSINVEDKNLGKIFLFNKLKLMINDDTNILIKSVSLDFLSDFLKFIIEKFDNLLEVLYFSYKILNNYTAMEDIPIISHAKDNLLTIFTSNSQAKQYNLPTIQSIARVKKIFELINSKKINADHLTHDSSDIIFKDYSLYVNNQLIVKIDHLQIKQGIYLLSGESGCGKSSTMIDLVSGVSPNLSSFGKIFLPKNADMMYLGKEIYKIPGETLLQTICYPINLQELSEKKRKVLKDKVILLLKKLQIDQFIDGPLSEEGIIKNLETAGKVNPSSGQMQKFGVVRAIITKPKILVIDEGLNAMDEGKSLPIAQKLIAEDLPNSTILVVDHGGVHHNFNNFFKGNIHFASNTISYHEYDLPGAINSFDS